MTSSTLPSEQRLMAAIAHASVVVFGPGVLVGVTIWLTQRKESAYASHQGLQAAVFQLVGMIVTTGMWIAWGICYFLTFIPMIQNPEMFEDEPPPAFWIGMASMVVPMLLMLGWIAYGLWGAVQCLQGRDFSYAFLRRYLPDE
jgi:hypothetical protein